MIAYSGYHLEVSFINDKTVYLDAGFTSSNSILNIKVELAGMLPAACAP